MNFSENSSKSNDLYEAAMAGIPERCRKRRCADAYVQALALTIASEAEIERVITDPELPIMTAVRVRREVALRVGAYCSAECLGYISNR